MALPTVSDFNQRGVALQRITDKYTEYVQLSKEREQNFIHKLLPGGKEPWQIVQPEGSEHDINIIFKDMETKNKITTFILSRQHIGASSQSNFLGVWYEPDSDKWSTWEGIVGQAANNYELNTQKSTKQLNKIYGDVSINLDPIDHYIETVEPALDKKLEKLKQ